jgi:hypothetical protein
VKRRAAELGIETPALASRAEVESFVRRMATEEAPEHSRLLNGWRREVVGLELADEVRGALRTA